MFCKKIKQTLYYYVLNFTLSLHMRVYSGFFSRIRSKKIWREYSTIIIEWQVWRRNCLIALRVISRKHLYMVCASYFLWEIEKIVSASARLFYTLLLVWRYFFIPVTYTSITSHGCSKNHSRLWKKSQNTWHIYSTSTAILNVSHQRFTEVS
jgi:hypothetical protein